MMEKRKKEKTKLHLVGNQICPFCRLIPPSDEEANYLMQKRADAGDVEAIHNLGFYYTNGMYGLPQDQAKALELWHRAAELGRADAYFNIGCNYAAGQGVERDMEKAMRYWEQGAMRGCADARHNLGVFEKYGNIDDMDRSIRHFMIAVRDGHNKSLEKIKGLYKEGYATKDDYTKALRIYQEYLNEVKSSQRDKAAAASEIYKYID